MNKGLRCQINRHMAPKINTLREKAHKCAAEDFDVFCEKIESGDFKVIKIDQIEVTSLNGEMSKNTIWKEAYLDTLSELFSEEDLEVLEAYSYSGAIAHCTVVRLKI